MERMRPIWPNHPKKDNAFEFRHCWLEHFNVKNVHALQNMVNDMNLDRNPRLIFLVISEACIESK
jgi:hypothetical protein